MLLSDRQKHMSKKKYTKVNFFSILVPIQSNLWNQCLVFKRVSAILSKMKNQLC